MECQTCINCNNKFETRSRGYKRTSIDSCDKLPTISIRSILSSSINTTLTPDKSLYVCNKCASSVVKIHKSQSQTKEALDEFHQLQSQHSYNGKRKRPLFQSTPKSTPSKHESNSELFVSPILKKCSIVRSPKKVVSPRKASHTQQSSKAFIDKAIQALRNSHYFRCFKYLYMKSKSAREGFQKLIKYAVRREMKLLNVTNLPFSRSLNEENLNNFSWKLCIESVNKYVPTLSSAVMGALTPTAHKEMKVTIDQENHVGPLLPAYGVLLSTILHLRSPSKINFLQDVVSVEMYRSSCSHKLFRWFNKLGICRSITTTRNLIDRLCQDFDLKLKTWKNNVQVESGNREEQNETGHNSAESDLDSESSGSTTSLNQSDNSYELNSEDDSIQSLDNQLSDEDLDGIVPLMECSGLHDDVEIIQEPGFSLCWDNVQKLSTKRHKTDGNNEMLLWALSFATQNRISVFHLDGIEDRVPATEIPLQDFMNKYFCGKSAASKGSLFKIRNRFQFNNVKKKVSDCVNDTTDFVTFVTEGLVCLLVSELMKVASPEEVPTDIPAEDKLSDYLREICVKVINIIWQDIDESIVKSTGDLLEETLPYQTEVDDLNTTLQYEYEFEGNCQDESDADDGPTVNESVMDIDDHKFMYTCGMAWDMV